MSLDQYLKTHKKTHLIFDLDKTLARLILPWNLVLDGIKDQLAKIDKSILKKYENGKFNLAQLENSYVKKDRKTKDLFIKNRTKFETKYLKEIVPNQKLTDFIKKNNQYKFYVWSSNTKSASEKVLKKLGVFKKFQKIITRNDVDFIKPEAEGFYKIYDPKLSKENYLFIGNSSYDGQAAKTAGIDFYLEDYFK